MLLIEHQESIACVTFSCDSGENLLEFSLYVSVALKGRWYFVPVPSAVSGLFPSFFINQNETKTVIDKTLLACARTLCVTVPEFPKW